MAKNSISLKPSDKQSRQATGVRLPARALSFVEQGDAFDYQIVDMEHVASVRLIAAQVRAAEDSALRLIVQIGQNLAEARKVLPHGSFGQWVKQACRFDQRTAARYIRVADVFGPIIDTVSNLAPSVAYIISAKRYPDDARQILIGRISTDAAVTVSDAIALANQPPLGLARVAALTLSQENVVTGPNCDALKPGLAMPATPTEPRGSLQDIGTVRVTSVPLPEQVVPSDKATILATKREKSRLAFEDRLISILGRRVHHDAEDFLNLLEKAGWSDLAGKLSVSSAVQARAS